MTKYTKSRDIKLTTPIGLYNEILAVMKEGDRWLTPQQFVMEAVREKIERWRTEHEQPPKTKGV